MTDSAQQAASIGAGYDADGPHLRLGAVVIDGTAYADHAVTMPLAMLNRHGLVAGATGTGKTKTLQLMAEQMSSAGIPVFLADVKGDLSGIAAPGTSSDRVADRSTEVGDEWAPAQFPVEFLTLGSDGRGAQVRVSMTSFGPTLLAKVLELNDTQESSLALVFHYADSAGLELVDLKDLRAVVQWLASDEGKQDLAGLGGLSAATLGVILRELTGFADNGGEAFFGVPEFDTQDLLRVTPDGKGVVTVLELSGVQDKPQVFSTFLMWLLADLFQELPEIGDPDKPKLVFFLDEAHLLFTGATKDFLTSVTQTVRLIRSKGVGVFFCTQQPTDLPDDVLGQLGNRVQHALRAFTPQDAKALKQAVATYPRSDVYDLGELLTQLGIGEAVITLLSDRGVPTPPAWTRLAAPRSLMAALDSKALDAAVQASPQAAKYKPGDDPVSAYEKLAERSAPAAAPTPDAVPARPKPGTKGRGREKAVAAGGVAGALGGFLGSSMGRSMTRSLGSALGREITRSLFGTSRRRR
ncbi:MAG TPA: helicase HerA-like domain-containing protein [Mycobacteriales bacterium]|nr:helicase HerA-like domain-containing protein [Mycobacteriales bacterium]